MVQFIILVRIVCLQNYTIIRHFSTLSDMQKFPLRMKDNDLLVTELYKDPSNDSITAISVYLTPKTTSKFTAIMKRVRYFLRAVVGIHGILVVVSILLPAS